MKSDRWSLSLIQVLLVWLCSLGGAVTSRAQTPPPNDAFAAAVVIPVLPDGEVFRIDVANALATAEPAELDNSALELTRAHGSVWWRWTAPSLGDVAFTLHNSDCNTVAGVFTGDSLEHLVPVIPVAPMPVGGSETPGVDRAGWIQFRARGGVTYHFAAGGFDNGVGPIHGRMRGWFNFMPTPGLENDFFADRVPITGDDVVVTGEPWGAGTEPEEPSAQFGLYKSLWWSYTAPANGMVRVTSRGLNGQTAPVVLGFSGDTLGSLSRRAIDSDLELQAGEVLHLAAGGENGFELRVRFFAPTLALPHDAFAKRAELPLGPREILENLRGATAEDGEPTAPPVQGGTLWWGLTPPVDGILEVGVTAEEFGPYPQLFSGNELASLTGPLVMADGGVVGWRLMSGQPYALRLGASYGLPGEFRMMTQFFPRPTNDAFASRIRIETNAFRIHSWIFDATTEAGEPRLAANVGQTVWWSWAATEDGRLETIDWNPDRNPLAIHTGPDLAHLSRVPLRPFYGDLESGMAAGVRAGDVCHLQAGAAAGVGQPVKVRFQFRPYGPALSDAFAQARWLEGASVRSTQSIVGATRELGEPLHLGIPDAGSVWWRWTAPTSGRLQIMPDGGTVSGVAFGLYQGPSIDALQKLTAGMGTLSWGVTAGEIYYLAAEVPAGTVGDVAVNLGLTPTSSSSRPVPGNLVSNFSFEELDEHSGFPGWIAPQGLDGVIGLSGQRVAVDGTNHAILSMNAISQVLATQAGQKYRLKLAVTDTDQPGAARVEIRIGDEVQEAIAFDAGKAPPFWRWREFEFTASSGATILEIRNEGVRVGLDAVSVVWLNEPPRIVQPPTAVTTFAGSPVALVAGVRGSEPLEFQWYRDEESIGGSGGRILQWEAVQPSDSGRYRLVVRNPWGQASTLPVQLVVEQALSPQIVVQPSGVSAVAGQYVSVAVAAVGTPPLRYQWYRDGQVVAGQTNRTLILPAVVGAEFGTYHVVVRNASESVTSLPAHVIRATGTPSGGARIAFAAWLPLVERSVDLTVYDLDGFTPLATDRFVAQLYAGSSVESLRPVGSPRVFQVGFYQGYWEPELLTLPHVPAMTPFVVQVRVWDARMGGSYEEARALGGRFGRSVVLVRDGVNVDEGQVADLRDMPSFSLTAGLPDFTVGRIDLDSRRPDGTPVWRLEGAPGFRYLVEMQDDGVNWKPFQVFEDFSGTATFETPLGDGGTVLFRARILD